MRRESNGVRVLVTRPREKAEELARELEQRGHAVLIEPLLEIEPLPAPPPALESVQAILLTSANAAHALRGEALGLPVHAVGEATATAARAAGCLEVHVAEGDARRLSELVGRRCLPADGALLHLSGQEVREELAGQLSGQGFEVRRQVVYRARRAGSFSPALETALRQRALDAVLLFSPRTAATFADLARHHRVDSLLDRTDALCLSAAVAQACGSLAWRRIAVAARRDRAALLELLEGAGRRC